MFAVQLLSSGNADYPGFVHFPNWAGAWEDVSLIGVTYDSVNHTYNSNVPLYAIRRPNNQSLLLGLSKDLCMAGGEVCNIIGCFATPTKMHPAPTGNCFRSRTANSSFDFYLAMDSSVLAGDAICKEDSAGLYSPNRGWLSCEVDDFMDHPDPKTGAGRNGAPFASFSKLPAGLIHQKCIKNPLCVAFRVGVDIHGDQHGDLYSNHSMNNVTRAPGWFALP